jgi:hypothetical protein
MAFGENLLANEASKYGPTGAPYAVPLSQDHILRTGIICAFHKLPLPAGEGWGGGSKT